MVFETMDSACWSTGARPPDGISWLGRTSIYLLPGTITSVSQTPLRVLIAEDEALIRLDLKEMLEEEGVLGGR